MTKQAADLGMNALAISDHGNMMGAFQFVREANKNGIKAIVGAELNVCREHENRSVKDDGYPTVLLAKNKAGYHELTKTQFQGLY
jgi:DNA polymerase-3 subunit alpha